MDAAELLIEGNGIYVRKHIETHYHWSLAELAIRASTALADRDRTKIRWGLLYRNRYHEEVHLRGHFWSGDGGQAFSMSVNGSDTYIFNNENVGVSDVLPSVYFAGEVRCHLQVVYSGDPAPVNVDFDMTLTHIDPPSYLRLSVYQSGTFTSFMGSSGGDHLALYNILSQLRGCRSLTVCYPQTGNVATVARKDKLESLDVMKCFRVAVNGRASEPNASAKFPDDATTLVIVGGDSSSLGRIERVFTATSTALPRGAGSSGDSTGSGSEPSPKFEPPPRR